MNRTLPVAPKDQQCATLFCANCTQIVAMEVPVGTAEELARKGIVTYCDICRPHAQSVNDALDRAEKENATLQRLKRERGLNPLIIGRN